MHRQFMKWISSYAKKFYLPNKKIKILICWVRFDAAFFSFSYSWSAQCQILFLPFFSNHLLVESNSLLSLVLHSRAPAFFFVCFSNNLHHTWRRDAMPHSLASQNEEIWIHRKVAQGHQNFFVYESWKLANNSFFPSLKSSPSKCMACNV